MFATGFFDGAVDFGIDESDLTVAYTCAAATADTTPLLPARQPPIYTSRGQVHARNGSDPLRVSRAVQRGREGTKRS